MKNVRILGTLNAMGSLLDALIAELEQEEAAGSGAECEHPPAERIDESTMGGPTEWRCRLCGSHSVTPLEEEDSNVSDRR